MAAMTLEELKAAVTALDITEDSGFNQGTQVVLLVGKTADGKYQFVQVDANGKLVTTA
jgi:hypothetical protein